MWIVPSCQFRQTIPFSIDQGFLLGPRPSLDLPFSCNSIENGFEVLGEHHRDWAPRRCKAAMEAGIVLAKPFVEALSRSTNVVPSIGTTQNVQVRPDTHTLAHLLTPYNQRTMTKSHRYCKDLQDEKSAEAASLVPAAILRDARKSALLRMRAVSDHQPEVRDENANRCAPSPARRHTARRTRPVRKPRQGPGRDRGWACHRGRRTGPQGVRHHCGRRNARG